MTIAESKPIELYCYVFGTVPDDNFSLGAEGAEVDFYACGRFFPNLTEIKREAKHVSYLGAGARSTEEIKDVASFTGMALKISGGTPYCYVRRAMHTLEGRSSSYGQIVICEQAELLKGDAFLRNILGFRFLTESRIVRGRIHKEDVEHWEKVSPVDLQQLPKERRDSLCLTAGLLLQGKRVMLRLPEGYNFMNLCRQVMLELFTLLPEVVRPQISFSTCRTEGDFSRLNNVQLLLVDENVSGSGAYTPVDLDASVPKVPAHILEWSRESEERRRDINEILFTQNETPERCNRFLEAYYDPKAWWWAQENPEKRFTSYDKIISALEHDAFDFHPAFCVQENWEEFCKRIPQLVQYEGDVQELLLDEYFRAKKKGDGLLKFVERAQHREGLFRAGLSEEEFKKVQEASMITKETLKRVDDQKKEFDQSVKTLKEEYDQSVKTQKEQFEAAVKEQEQKFSGALQKHKEDLERQRQEDNVARLQDKEDLFKQLKSMEKTLLEGNQNTNERIRELDTSINSKVDNLDTRINGEIVSLNQNLQETERRLQAANNSMEERFTILVNDKDSQQNSEREALQNEIKSRLDNLDKTVSANASQQRKDTDALNKRLNSIKRSEGGSGNKAALILAIAGCALVVAVVVLLIVGMVKYLPAAQYAKREVEATPTLVPVTPAPTDTPAPTAEPTLTPAPTVVPYELGKYIAVCNSYVLILTESEEDRWVYANDLVQVVIRERVEGEEIQKEEIPSKDGKYILIVSAIPEIQGTEKNFQAQKLRHELKDSLSSVAEYAPTPKPEEGNVSWLRQLLKLEDTVTVNQLEKVPEALEALLEEIFQTEGMYLYEVEFETDKVYFLLSKTADLYEVKTSEATEMACRKVIEKIEDSEYVLYVFAADAATVDALFPVEATTALEPSNAPETTSTPAATVTPTNTPTAGTTEPQEE